MKKVAVKRADDKTFSDDEEEPLSPQARIYLSPLFNIPIIAIVGFKTRVNPDIMVQGFKDSLINHPRFSSKVVIDERERGNVKWMRTIVNADDHIIIPDLNPKMENPDQFVEDYISNLSTVPMDLSKPLWEFHLLNVETSESEAIGVFRINHAVGDGASLISLLLACTRKTSDPDALPSLPVQTRSKESSVTSGMFVWWLFLSIWRAVTLIWNTTKDFLEFIATIIFLKDTKNPLIGEYGVYDQPHAPKRLVHRTFSLDDIKLVKKATNTTVNDVVLGATQAGLSQYLNRNHGSSYIHPKSNRPIRALTIFNLRSVGIESSADMMAKGSKVRWGNKIGYVFLPLNLALHNDPLDYIYEAKSTMDRKKNSLAALCISYTAHYLIKMFGDEAYVGVSRTAFANTSLTFSNVVGPTEEIGFYGHAINFLASATFEIPQALTVHFQSYMDKMTLVITVDPNVIPDPHRLCEDIKESLKIIVDTVVARGLVKDSF